MAQKIKNRGDWYLADIVERAEAYGREKTNPNRRCTTWVNTILIKANSIEEAYDKALSKGRKSYETRYKTVSGVDLEWKVIGIMNLTPIDEDIEDGAEIAWENKGFISAKRGDGMVKSKQVLVKGR